MTKPAIAEQDHPPGGAHGVADEERQDHRHQQQVLEARSRAREAIGHRKREHDADRRAQRRHADRPEQDRAIERIGEELGVVLERDRVDHHLGRRELVEAVAEQDDDRQHDADRDDDGRRRDHRGGRPPGRTRARGGCGHRSHDRVTRPICEASALERLVPPLLQRGVVLREVAVVEVDQALPLFRVEADAFFRLGRDLRVGDACAL